MTTHIDVTLNGPDINPRILTRHTPQGRDTVADIELMDGITKVRLGNTSAYTLRDIAASLIELADDLEPRQVFDDIPPHPEPIGCPSCHSDERGYMTVPNCGDGYHAPRVTVEPHPFGPTLFVPTEDF